MLVPTFRRPSQCLGSRRKRATLLLSVEHLEDRHVPSTFSVLNLSDGGAGSLRQAILDANANVGSDLIHFDVAGTIRLTTRALPAITDVVDIDGTTAPGFAGTPAIEVNYRGFGGLQFNAGSAGSTLRSLGLVNASDNGVTVNGVGNLLIVGNSIGLRLDGATAAGNGGNGVELIASSDNTIGGVAAQDRNLISGNHLNGIRLTGGSDNQIVANYIGTDATGTLDRGNFRNGITLTGGATRNIIGGAQGNLISGNNTNGVLVTGLATRNQLGGNFIGTTASGNAALGNALDGVRIANADNNSLIGCTIQQDPFVFYNVMSGNGGNGLRITNANDTTIQANFIGLGADNDTAVGNALDGVVVEGSSANTLMGGPIPLGNVVAANGQNGIVVRDQASGFVTYNTFCGLAAFSDNLNLGNGRDGMLITTTGGNILIRTNVITRNGDDGIELSGAATGVRVAGNIIGLNTQGQLPMGNLDNGVEVRGHTHHNVIGGPQPTFNIIPHNVISANGGNGVAVVGQAHDIRLSHSYIGTDLIGENAVGNVGAGVFIGPGTVSTTIGSRDPNFITVISGNLGNGIEMSGTRLNRVVGSLIGTNAGGALPLPNAGNGVFIGNSFDNVIGRTSSGANGTAGGPANLIAFNGTNGVYVDSGSRNGILENSIHDNALMGIDLAQGANLNQAAPVLTLARLLPLGTEVTGTLTSRPNTAFSIEFFANDANDPSGHFFLGFQVVTTNAAGTADFTFFGLLPPVGANFVTATATDPENNTSEFAVMVV